MAAVALKHPATLDEFLAWEERQAERFEFVDGRVYAMSGGTGRHDRLTRQLANALERVLDGRSCDVHGPLVKVTTPSGAAAYPDVFVRSGPIDDATTRTDDPVALFEVLSPGSMHYDLKRKRRQYEAIPSLRFIGFVWPEVVAVSFAVRGGDGGWADGEAEGADAVLGIEALGIAVALREVYARTDLLRGADGPGV